MKWADRVVILPFCIYEVMIDVGVFLFTFCGWEIKLFWDFAGKQTFFLHGVHGPRVLFLEDMTLSAASAAALTWIADGEPKTLFI